MGDLAANKGKNMDWTNKLAILTGWKVHIWVDGNLTSILTRSSYFSKETWLQYCNYSIYDKFIWIIMNYHEIVLYT